MDEDIASAIQLNGVKKETEGMALAV